MHVATKHIFTIEKKGKDAAIVILFVLSDHFGEKPAGYIHQVFTESKYRRQGLALRLVKRAIKRAEEEGCYKCFLICDESLMPLYKKAGMAKHQVGMEIRFKKKEG